MTDSPTPLPDPEECAAGDFEIRTLADEIRVDGLCARLLQLFLDHLRSAGGLSPLAAGSLAQGADYFLRDFVIADRRDNIFLLPPGRVRQFAGNWYIVRTLEPNLTELAMILRGVQSFYDFCRATGRVSAATAEAVAADCADLAYYQKRIDDFWNIEHDGYDPWERECTLKN